MPRKTRKSRDEKIILPLDGDDLKSVHIQGRLNPNTATGGTVRAYDAYQVYAVKHNEGKDDGWIIRESLIAMGVLESEGKWKPQDDITPVAISMEAVKAVRKLSGLAPIVKQIQEVVSQLLSLDLSNLHTSSGEKVDGAGLKKKLTAFDQSATDMLSDTSVYHIDE